MVISFYLWYVLVKQDLEIEKRCFWWVSAIIWLSTIVYTISEIILSTNEDNWGVLISSFNCKGSKNKRNFYGYAIPTISLVFVALIMTCHTSVILYNRWKKFNDNMNRTTAIKLGRAVRLNILCILYITYLLFTLIPRFISHHSNLPSSSYL
ncbi:1210_t:CDS:2, partial [Funneliformis caledonium]